MKRKPHLQNNSHIPQLDCRFNNKTFHDYIVQNGYGDKKKFYSPCSLLIDDIRLPV